MRGRRFSTLYAPRCPARCPFPASALSRAATAEPKRDAGGSPFAGSDRETTSRRGAVMACARVSAPRDPAFSAGPRQMTAALPWSAPPLEAVRAEPTGWRETSDQPRVRGARRAPDPRAPGTAPLRGMPRSTPRIVWVRRLSTMAQQRRCALICKTSDCYGFGPNRPLKPFALPPPIGESRTDDGPREQLEAGNNPGSRQEVESLQGACPLRSGTPNPRPTDGGPPQRPTGLARRADPVSVDPGSTRGTFALGHVRTMHGPHSGMRRNARADRVRIRLLRARIRRENGHETAVLARNSSWE